ncbi:CD40 ligand [Notolabrus celidotus]|uniref:CD40 ligand n=1 Tax=Notolabrus celidotus TaxID=1203425 RepID=UPI00148F6B53|nr:CD40 ligand [Notolabrus celidotus]
MINTFQTSLAPPPVPPRHHNGSHPILIPASLPSHGHSKSLFHFLVGMALLHLFLTVGGFIYLSYQMDKQHKPAEGRASFLSPEKQKALPLEKPGKALAHLVVDQQSHTQKSTSSPAGYLQWNRAHSDLRNMSLLYKSSWVVIQKPGKYYVYSKVTFSKRDPTLPLSSMVMLRKSDTGIEKAAMKAYCSLDSHRGTGSIPNMCTAMQGEVVPLENGHQLSVWVQDLSLVDYEDGATAFGMYEL